MGKKIDSAIIPGLQGGPHNATTAAIAIATAEASTSKFKQYARQIKKNAQALAEALMSEGLTLVGHGTETHLMLIDLSKQGYGLGRQVAFALDVAGIYANANTIPNESGSPFYPSGVRIGTPLVTTRGMKEAEMKQIAHWIALVIEEVKKYELPLDKNLRNKFVQDFKIKVTKNKNLKQIAREVKSLAERFPLFAV